MKAKLIIRIPKDTKEICPCCGYEGEENGICVSYGGVSEYVKVCRTYIVYNCHRCGCEWQIEEK